MSIRNHEHETNTNVDASSTASSWCARGVGLTLANYLRLAEASPLKPTAEACIFVHLKGGPSHLDTLDMKPEAPSAEQGEFKRIQTVVPGYEICEHLPRLAKWIDRFTLIRGISHAAGLIRWPTNICSPAIARRPRLCIQRWERSAPKNSPRPRRSRRSSQSPTPTWPGFLGVGYGSFKTTSVPKPGQPFEVRGLAVSGGLTIDKIKSRNELLRDLDQTFRTSEANSAVLEGLDRFSQKANEMILSDRARQAFRREPRIAPTF